MPAFFRLITLLGAASALATANGAPVSSSAAVTCTRPITTTLCRDTPGEVNVKTPVGVARGLQSSSNSTRFAVRYASADRWALPTKATEWATSGDDVNKLPPVCPQEYVDASSYSEDCLQLIIYTPPPKPLLNPSVPVLVWVHGGSFVVGSASGPGLDGAALAKSTGAMVVVVQYRLGALGFIPPSSMNGNSNLGVRDVITALEFTRQVVPTFGGNINQVTVAGQSSGGQMIRALLASPSASSLFKYAAIHSDPMDYGFYKPETIEKQQNYLYTQTSGALAACNNAIDCQKKVPLAQLLKAQSEMLNMSPALDPATAGGSPVRPHHDGRLLQYTLTGDSFPPASGLKPVLVLTVKDEAASTVGGNNFFPDPVPAFYFAPTITTYFNDTEDRGTKLVSSSNYDPSEYSSQAGVAKDDEARAAFTQLFTDGYWRCPSWTFSRTWASKGVSAYVGEFQIGATYPSNSDIDYCTTGGRVCHEDDIYILFGTTPSPTSAQTALTKEIQARYSNFIRSGNPNPSAGGYANWSPSGTTDVKAIKLGGTGNRAAEACDPSFWGKAIPYDYQLYGL